METVRLGKTGMMVSRLGLGGIPIQRVSEAEAVAVVKRCLELGITFIDTANAYTTSEERIGKAILGCRERFVLATKTQARTREGIGSHLKLSLKRLGVKYIDLYQFHGVSDAKTLSTILAPDGPMKVVEDAKRAGLIKHIGVSSHSLDIAKELVVSGRFETIMFPFNFLNPESVEVLLPLAREHDVGFIGMKPMAGGMLGNASIAFKYIFQFPDVVPIPGIEKISEVEEIVQILEGPLTITLAERREMGRIGQELGKRFCHRCDYCQPCTAEIPISSVMNVTNFAKRIPLSSLFSGVIADSMAKAADCTKCGECEERCPYGLPISQIIEEYVNWYQAEKRKYQEQLALK